MPTRRSSRFTVTRNPKQPGRPSHVNHSYMLANVRLVLDVEVMAVNEHTSNHSGSGLWALLDGIGRDCWPKLLRGDKGFSSEAIMSACEARGLLSLFGLRLTNKVKRAIERMAGSGWQNAGQGWQGIKHILQLSGWLRARRVVLRAPAHQRPYLGSIDARTVLRVGPTDLALLG